MKIRDVVKNVKNMKLKLPSNQENLEQQKSLCYGYPKKKWYPRSCKTGLDLSL